MILVDRDLNAAGEPLEVAYSNSGSSGTAGVQLLDANIYHDGVPSRGQIAAVSVELAPREVQVLAPLAAPAGARRTKAAAR